MAAMRVNFFGGPGSGKSTTTAQIFAELKQRGRSVEHVSEYVKAWAYQKREVKQFDQLYLFAKQHHMEYTFLSNGVRHIVSDSPCFQSVIYAKYYTPELARPLADLCHVYDRAFPCLNIFLSRGRKPYNAEGRYQTEAEAHAWDARILDALHDQYRERPVVLIDVSDRAAILDTVLEATR